MGGTFKSITCGISRGCSLSPIIAAYYLKGLDKQMDSDTRYFYRRYMDDVIVLSKTRWHLRKAVKIVNMQINQLKVAQAPDKIFIGKIEKGLIFYFRHSAFHLSDQLKLFKIVPDNFVGYRFGLPIFALAEKTITNAVNKLLRLYQ